MIISRYDQLYDKVIRESSDECWTFSDSGNYACVRIAGIRKKAHRVAYELYYSISIPTGLEPDHLCKNKSCWNPRHIELVTRAENMRRSDLPEINRERAAKETSCRNGHPYTHESIYNARGWRECSECRRNNVRNYRERIRDRIS